MNHESMNHESNERDLRAVAEKIRVAYLEMALNSYEDAAANGLCAQGALECAVDAMRRVDVASLIQEVLIQDSLFQSHAAGSEDQISSRVPSGSRR
jgi:hypothetical protein